MSSFDLPRETPDPLAPIYPPRITPEEEQGQRIDQQEMDTYPGTTEEDEPKIPAPEESQEGLKTA